MYKQLTPWQRYTLAALKQEGLCLRRIGEHLGVHYSTVSRELRRNRVGSEYDPAEANRMAQVRRHKPRKPEKLTPEAEAIIDDRLKKHWSPEQISGRLKLEGTLDVSPETIYKRVRLDKDAGGSLCKYLRRGGKRRRRRYGSVTRHKLNDKRSIDERPEVVDAKSRIGDWETDTITSKRDSAALVTLVERVSKYTVIGAVGDRRAYRLARKMTRLLGGYRDKVLTITSDNGTEFACHGLVAEGLDADFFFAHPYSPGERGLNENTNGLIRQYFPKGKSLKNAASKVRKVMDELNDRPRKSLGYRTPKEVFFGLECCT